MEELIEVQLHQDKKLVSARKLYKFLGVQTAFTHWCNRMFEYGFVEGIDYSLVKIGRRSAHNKTDYLLTIDTAKEIGMIQRTDKGREIRNYFIALEKSMQEVKAIVTDAELMALKGQAELCKLKREKKALRQKIAPELKKISQISRKMGKIQNTTFIQLGFFDEALAIQSNE